MIENITAHIVTIRNIVCPRTSYATSGEAASVVYALVSSDQKMSFDLLAISLQASKEFDRVTTVNEIGELTGVLNGNVMIIYGNFIENMLETIESIFAAKKTKLAVLVNFGQVKEQESKINNVFSVYTQNFAGFHITSYYNYRTQNKYLSNSGLLDFNGQPAVASQKQFRFLWTEINSQLEQGKERVLQRLAERGIHGFKDRKYSMKEWDDIIHEALVVKGLDDYAVYDVIREKVLGGTLSQHLQANHINSTKDTVAVDDSEGEVGDGRANHMVSRTMESIPIRLLNSLKISHSKPNDNNHLSYSGNSSSTMIRTLLDYGCAEGAITAALGKQLGLTPNNILGADVRTIPAKGFTFVPLAAENPDIAPAIGSILPTIPTGSIDIINAAMVFHHVTHIHQVMLELRRVISSHGILIIREHHCNSPDMGAFLDITHGLYSLSWSMPVEWPDFITEYRAFYRSREQWDALLYQAGFTLCIEECGPRGKSNYHATGTVTTTTTTNSGRNNNNNNGIRKANGSFPNVIKAYYAVYKPTPGFVIPLPATVTKKKTANDHITNVHPGALDNNVAMHGDTTISSSVSSVVGKRKILEDRTEATSTAAGTTKLSKLQENIVSTSSSDVGLVAAKTAVQTSSSAIYESKKYPGRFYKLNPITGATEWV